MVTGKVLKINPFGAFVELDKDIHGLVHISELNETEQKKSVKTPLEIGKTYEFKIISLEPSEHRLGLSLKAVKSPKEEKLKTEAKEEKTEKNKK